MNYRKKILLNEAYTPQQLEHFRKFMNCFFNRSEIVSKPIKDIPFKQTIGPGKSPVQEEIYVIKQMIQQLNEWDDFKKGVGSLWDSGVKAAKELASPLTSKLWLTITGNFGLQLASTNVTSADNSTLKISAVVNVYLKNMKIYTELNPQGSSLFGDWTVPVNVSATLNYKITTKYSDKLLTLDLSEVSSQTADVKIYQKADKRLYLDWVFKANAPKSIFQILSSPINFSFINDSCLTANVFGSSYSIYCFGSVLQGLKDAFEAKTVKFDGGFISKAFDPGVSLSNVFPQLACRA